MRTLFVKLFFWFWIASTIAGLVSFMLAMNTKSSQRRQDPEHLQRHARPVIQALTLFGAISAAGLEREGTLTTLNAGNSVVPGVFAAHLFAENGTPLSASAPPELTTAVNTFAAEGAPADKPYVVRNDDDELVAVRVTGPSGKPYIAAGLMSQPPPRKHLVNVALPPDMWFRICVSIVIGGVACYVMAWWIASPIRHLRAVTQRLSAGDLSVRAKVKRHHDEIDDLGRDFNRMAQRIEDLVSVHKQLVRDISHELRSPLARLNVALGLARREAGATTRMALDRIELEAERLNFLISDLLTLSLLEGGGDTLSHVPFDLCDLATEVTADADFEAASRNRQVLLVSCEQFLLVGDRELLRRGLENIVRNGIRYTAEGTAVEVSLSQAPDGRILLKVRDHGPGVPEPVLANIFKPFYRVAEDRDRNSGGAGIGLAIVERTVRLFGGTILAHNAPDGGLVIEIRLPRSEAA